MTLESCRLFVLFQQRCFGKLWCVKRQISIPNCNRRTLYSLSVNGGNRLLGPSFSGTTEHGKFFVPTRSLSNLSDQKLLDNQPIQVYAGPLIRMVKTVKVFSLSTSAIGLALQPLLIIKALPYGTVLTIFVGGFIGLYAIATPLILHWVAKRYVISLCFEPQNKIFTCTTLGLLLQKHKLQFSAEEVGIPDVPGPLTSFIVRNKPLLIDPDHFTDPTVYAHLMGYDKPLNLQLDSTTSSDQQSPRVLPQKQ